MSSSYKELFITIMFLTCMLLFISSMVLAEQQEMRIVAPLWMIAAVHWFRNKK